MSRTLLLSDQIRKAVKASGMTRYRISQELGIHESTLHHFVHGGWLGQENMNALAALLGLTVTTTKAKKGR